MWIQLQLNGFTAKNLKSTVDSILDAFSMEIPVFRQPAHGRFIAHKPEGSNASFHQGTESCFKNIPLQSCSNICGVIVVVMAAISCLNPTLWRSGFLDTKSSLPKEISWVKNPTVYSHYLRRVLIHWETAKDVALQLLGIKPSLPGDQFTSTTEECAREPPQMTDQEPSQEKDHDLSQDTDSMQGTDQDLSHAFFFRI